MNAKLPEVQIGDKQPMKNNEILQQLHPAFVILAEFLKNPPPKKPVQTTLHFYSDKACTRPNYKGGENP
jgi:hypothetical protein